MITYEIVLYEDSLGSWWGECSKLKLYFIGHTIHEALVNARIAIEITTKQHNFNIDYKTVEHD